MRLQGNTILITGGSSGIGLELARRLSSHNQILICGRSVDALKNAQREIPSVKFFECDLAKKDERVALVNWIAENHPRCNVLVNNAAIVHKVNFAEDTEMVAKAELEIEVNLIAPIVLSKLLLPLIIKNPNPAIVNVTTGLVYAPRIVYPIYNATKAGLHAFSKVLREQLKSTGIEVVEVLMAVVDTPWHKGSPPRTAVSVQTAVSEMISQWMRGKKEIKIGKVKLLYWLSRLAPQFAFKKVNQL